MIPSIRPFTALSVRASFDEKVDNRKKTLAAVKEWREADQELKRICAEKGIAVPEMIC